MQFKAIPKRKFILLVGDIFIILLSTLLGFIIRIGEVINFLDVYTGASLINLSVFPVLFYIAGLYDLQENFRSLKVGIKITASIVIGVLIISSLFYAIPPYRYGRGIFLIKILILTPFIYIWRIFFLRVFKAAVKPKRILLMGKDGVLEDLCKVLQGNPEYKVVGFINVDTGMTGNPFPAAPPVLDLEGVEEKVKQGALDGIVIDFMEERSQSFWQKILKFKVSGIDIIGALSFYQELTGKIPIYSVNNRWFVYAPGYALLASNYIRRVKRLFDIGVFLVALPIALPILGLGALAIKLDSPGSVFYRQRRVGQDEKEFNLIKFRTMVHNAEEGTGAVWASENDPRITRVGKILRHTRLDELPQLINVLMGEMSFIGPRPERPEFVKELKEKIPFYSLRHSVKPGITGWAQVNYQYGASVEDAIEKLQYDLFYIQNMSFLFEIGILLKTIQVVLFGKGSR